MTATLDTWTSLFLISAGQGIFLSVLIFSARTRINRLLGGVILAYSLALTYYVLYWTGYIGYFSRYIHILYGMSYLIGPLFYAYVRADRKYGTFNYREFLPFLLSVLYQIGFPLYPKEDLRMILGVQDLIQNLHLLTYLVVTLRWWRHNRSSYNGKIALYRSRVVIAFTGYALCFFSYYVIYYAGALVLSMDYLISFMSSIFIYYIGYVGFKQPDVLFDREPPTAKYERSGITVEAAVSLLEALDVLMKRERLYLNGTLRLADVAQAMEVSQHHISQALNIYRQIGFADYINFKRLQHARELLEDPALTQLRIQEIAARSGFNNKTTFNALFKRELGQSPGVYRKSFEQP